MQDNSIFYDWLKRRHVTDAIINDFGITVGNHYPLRECLFIPIHNEEGVFAYNKYRRNPTQSGDKYMYDKGSKAMLYAWNKAKESKIILVTEGEMDALVAWSHNIPAVSSTGGAMTFAMEWAQRLADKDVTLCFDNDEAGGKGMVRVLSMVPHAKVLFLPDRPGIKDISDYVQNGGNLPELLRSAIQFKSLQEVIDDRAERLALWRSTWFHDSYIKTHTIPKYEGKKYTGEPNSELDKAKQYPIHNLIKFNHDKKAPCVWHNERTASMHYYADTNTVYCFGCGKHGDAIDIIRQMTGCSFTEAIKKLI